MMCLPSDDFDFSDDDEVNIKISMIEKNKTLKFQTQDHTKIPMKIPMKYQKVKCNLIQK